MEQKGSNRRKVTRVPFDSLVSIRTENGEIEATVNSRDISIKGIFVQTRQPFSVGDSCTISIVLGGSTSRESIKAEGKVVRREESGVGIFFESVDLDSFMHLKKLVLYNADDPEEVEKEPIIE